MLYLNILSLIVIVILAWKLFKNTKSGLSNCDRYRASEMNRKKDIEEEKLIYDLLNNRFEVYLQPKIGMENGKTINAEALIRYRDIDGAVVSPGEFVPDLEALKLIHYVDLFVLEQVVLLLEKWAREKMVISLNFSRNTVLADNILEKVEMIVEGHGICRSQIEIEITESMDYENEEILFQRSNELHNRGFGLSLDDFGSRYSNVFILSKLPFDTLKLDKSIVDHMLTDRRSKIIVEEFLDTCKKLGIHSVAEGVETKEQDEILKQLGCDYGQGYLYDKPLTAEEFEKKYIYA